MSDVVQRKSRLLYINYMRAFAIIMIVLGHTVCWGVKNGVICETNTYLFKGGTFVFVFIAGFLFQYLSYKFNYIEYIKKKFFYVVLPYVFCILPAALIFTLTDVNINNPFSHLDKLMRFLSSLFFGLVLNNPTWFVGMIVIFFIFAPVFLCLRKNSFLWFSILIISLISTLLYKRPSVGYAIYHLDSFDLIFVYSTFLKLFFKSFLYFSSLYLWGMFTCIILEKYYSFVKKHIKAFIFSILGMYVFFYVIYIMSHFNHIYNTAGHFCLIFLLLSTSIYFEPFIKKLPALDKILNTLAEYSFGIFFIHQYFINLLVYHSIYDTFQTPYFNINQNTFKCFSYTWGMFIVTLCCSFITLWLLRKFLVKCGVKTTRKFIGV